MSKINVRLRRTSLRSGFTLFEMLVVVSIIGILLGLITSSFSAAQQRARDSRRIQDLNNLQKSMEQYYSLCASYPTNLPYAYGTGAVTLTGSMSCASVGTTILPKYPQDPGHNLGAGGGNTYFYSILNPQTASNYCLCALLEVPGNVASYSVRDCVTTAASNSYYCVRNAQ